MRMLERVKREEGFTIVEILIASFILVLASLAVFMTFASAIKNVQRSRDNQMTVSVAQRELERVRAVGMADFDALGLKEEPAPFYDRIVGDDFILDRVDRGEGAQRQPLVFDGEVQSSVTPRPKASDGTEFTVNVFVTCESPVIDESCAAKRIIVTAVPDAKANAAGYQQTYRELQTTVAAPLGTES